MRTHAEPFSVVRDALIDVTVRVTLGGSTPVTEHLHEVNQVHSVDAVPVMFGVMAVVLVVMPKGVTQHGLDLGFVLRRTIGQTIEVPGDLGKHFHFGRLQLACVVGLTTDKQLLHEPMDKVADARNVFQGLQSGFFICHRILP